MTFEIRLHGIGGQGVAASADLLAMAAVDHGWYAHSFPSFGTEIRGGSVTAFARIARNPIHVRSFIYKPNLIVVFSGQLLSEEIWKGAGPNTIILANSNRPAAELPFPPDGRLVVLDADGIATRLQKKVVVNAILLGAMLPFVSLLELKNLETALWKRFSPATAALNISGLHEGLAAIQSIMEAA